MAYQIGQLRFSGKGCVTNLGYTPGYQAVSASVSESSAGNSSFQDVILTPNTGSFVRGKDYYVSLAIPQDMNYNLEFNIKLTKKEDNKTQVYQYLKNVTVNRGGTGANVYNVALYEKSNGSVAAMIPLTYRRGITTVKDSLYYEANDANGDGYEWYLGTGSTVYNGTNKVNNLAVVASWKQETGVNYGIFELVFRPVEDGFDNILLEMVRSPEDYDIQRTDSSGVTEYGRKVDITKMKVTLYEINNLVDSMNKGGTLTRVGVWSHTGLIMALNGEEIKVGPSGFYEQDVIEIESLGIVAPDNNWDYNWTIDYMYNIDEEEEEISEGGN